jgi:hypothetical protein
MGPLRGERRENEVERVYFQSRAPSIDYEKSTRVICKSSEIQTANLRFDMHFKGIPFNHMTFLS